jgi:hypothetical protein
VLPVGDDATGATSSVDDGNAMTEPGPIDDTAASTMTGITHTSASPDTGTSGDTSDAEDGDNPFIINPDGGGKTIECDLWADDCPPGEKCMPWANDGGHAWNATRCSPLAEDPQQVDEPCTVVDSPVSGVDDCEAHAMCWNVDPDTLMGTCVGFCSGSEANPTCDDPCKFCPITSDGVLILCLRRCDPLAQDCGEGQGCYLLNDEFGCAPDASAEMGALGEGCEFVNACDPGLFCANAEAVPDCVGIGCCAAFCDALAADACEGMPAGVECIPLFEDGQRPECGSGVAGGCLLPQ